MLPSFLLIGAARAGTTALHWGLKEHPEIFMCEPKEPCYFSDERNWARGIAWYESLFQSAGRCKAIGEASAAYSRYPQAPHVAPRLAELLPDVSLIYSIRSPIDRTYSHYCYLMRLGISCSFDEAIERHPMLIDGSDYLMQIRRYMDYFPREQLHVVLFDDLTSHYATTIQHVYQFLHVADFVPPIDLTSTQQNSATDVATRTAIGRTLRKTALGRAALRVVPKQARLAAYEGLRRARALPSPPHFPPMHPHTRQMLAERFAPSIVELSDWLGIDLTHWIEYAPTKET